MINSTNEIFTIIVIKMLSVKGKRKGINRTQRDFIQGRGVWDI